MRRKIVAGNWKMNKNAAEAELLLNDLASNLPSSKNTQVIVSPAFVFLEKALKHAKSGKFEVAAQNCAMEKSGAYTGEVSATMLQTLGVEYVIIGHSERRQYFGETNELLLKKMKCALEAGLIPIYCLGESLEERNSGKHFERVSSQVKNVLFQLDANEMAKCIVAYEPVWAIGTGLTASTEQAQEMHRFIRNEIEKKIDKTLAESISILYGGSCNPSNASELFAQPDVDGGLIGGASLKSDDFCKIVAAASSVS